MFKGLRFWEVPQLYICGKLDAKNRALISFNPANVSRESVISPFIVGECARLSTLIQILFANRMCIVSLRTKKCKTYYRLMPLSAALRLMEKKISFFDASIQNVRTAYEVPVRNVLADRERYRTNNAGHMVQLCNNKLVALEKEITDAVLSQRQSIESLLDEKIRLLKNTFTHYDVLCSRRFMRIKYYYEVASRFKNKNNTVSINTEDYEEFIDRSVAVAYQKDLDETIKLRDVMRVKVQQPTSESEQDDINKSAGED